MAVITASAPAGPVGLTTNALCSLSLEPLMVLVCFDNGSRTLETVRETRRFGVNLLRADQGDLSRVFASKLPGHAKFEGVPHREHDGVPILLEALGWVTCELADLHPGGDHTIGTGHVRELQAPLEADPLVFYRGDYRGVV